jgi:ABC-type transporter Mla MlaB component
VPHDTAFRLSGEQTVRTIAATRRELATYCAEAAAIAIDAAGVTDADLTLVQLIESARRTAARDGKRVCMTAHPSEALRDVLVRGGFLNSPANALFWTAP